MATVKPLIDAQEVSDTFFACLYKNEELIDGERPEGAIMVDAIILVIMEII